MKKINLLFAGVFLSFLAVGQDTTYVVSKEIGTIVQSVDFSNKETIIGSLITGVLLGIVRFFEKRKMRNAMRKAV